MLARLPQERVCYERNMTAYSHEVHSRVINHADMASAGDVVGKASDAAIRSVHNRP